MESVIVTPDAGFVPVADRVWVARYASYDLNIGLIAGSRGLVLIDSRESAAAAEELLEDLRAVADPSRLVAVINTHDHHDHVQGNQTVLAAAPGIEVICHEQAAAGTPGHTHTVSSVHRLDLGDRALEVVHPGPGHTSGDLVIGVPDVGVLFTGDLVEESAPPSFGSDSHPLAWPDALGMMLQMSGPEVVVIPGHGAPVDRAFMADQAADLAVLAQTVTELAGRGVSAAEAPGAATWPWPEETVAAAIAVAWKQLPAQGRRLPLV